VKYSYIVTIIYLRINSLNTIFIRRRKKSDARVAMIHIPLGTSSIVLIIYVAG
jgi:hypothetical protein